MPTSASLHSPRLRPAAALSTLALAGASLAGVSLAGATAAVAAPGDSGDVRVQRAGTPARGGGDATTVCQFRLSAVNFETVPLITFTISPLPPAPAQPTLTGSITLVTGRGDTANYSVPNGQYQLTWTFPGGLPKQKVFKVDCDVRDDRDRPSDGQGRPSGDERERPSGAVPAGGGGVADVASTEDESAGLGPWLGAGAVVAAGLFLVRRARRRNHGAA